MDRDDWLEDRFARARRTILAAKDRLVRSKNLPEGEGEAFRAAVLDEMGALERDIRAIDAPQLDAEAVRRLASLLATASVTTMRRFQMFADVDVVAEGVLWPAADVAVVRWHGEFPTSVVFHDRGLASLEAAHSGTRIEFLDP